MRIEDLKSFVVLAEVCSFHAAAERLNITQPALSRRIQKLEEQLKTQVLERTTQKVRLTSAGVRFLHKIRPLVMDAETAIHEMRSSGNMREGILRIACLPSFGIQMLPGILREMNALRPRLSFRVHDANALGVLQMLSEGEADIGFGLRVGDHSDLSFTPLFDEPFGILCHRDHPVAEIDGLCWPDLAEHAFVYNLSDSGNWLIIMNRLEREGLTMNCAYQVHSLFGLIALVRSGIALGMVPKSLATTLGSTDLVYRPVRDPTIHRSVSLIDRGEAAQPGYIRQFMEIAKAHAKLAGPGL